MSESMRSPMLLRGLTRLAFEATVGLTGVVESMHHNISRKPFILGKAEPGPAHGLTGLVYGSVRGVMRLVGASVDVALGQIEPLLGPYTTSIDRHAAVAILNGVLGDHLVTTGNPIATHMHLRHRGQAVDTDRPAAGIPHPTGKVAVLLHGLCMNDRGWQRSGHDYGASLEGDLGYTPLHLVYNSGLHVSQNGQQLADLLEAVVTRWPVAVEELVLVGHSMGGLVARSGCHYGRRRGHRWVERLRAMVFLGTPHHGAALERAGNAGETIIGVSPYSAPLGALGRIRSSGITDLRHGSVVDEDWQGCDRFARKIPARTAVPLPTGVECFTLAAALRTKRGGALVGDGLVPLDSALGQHEDPRLALAFRSTHRTVVAGIGHIDLLGHPEVYARIRQWLATLRSRTP